MLGAWISGGIEWNVFHHHRASSFSPVDYALQENPDGSVTAWIGEIEIRHRMKWRLGITVFPGRSYIEAKLVPYNRSPFLHSMLYFANAGVHANDDYQVVFPPSTEWVTQHAKAEYAAWPIAHENYNHVDFTAQGREFGTDGVDISRWKNNIQWISFFAYNYEDDWVAGYDHGKKAGTLVLGNHHVAPGKKFWTWGSGDHGQVWDKLLTDSDGPELELMAGGYSDNEPDYSWLQPHRSKEVSHYFYPLREIGSLKNANLEAAVGLEVTGRPRPGRLQRHVAAGRRAGRPEGGREGRLRGANRHQPLEAVLEGGPPAAGHTRGGPASCRSSRRTARSSSPTGRRRRLPGRSPGTSTKATSRPAGSHPCRSR